MSRFRVAVAVAALLLASVGFIAGRATAPTGRPELTRSTTTTTDADLSAEDAQLRTALRPFVGEWTWHGEAVHIDSDGSGTAVWRMSACRESQPPCDTVDGNFIISGGAAFFILIRADESAADGYVLTSSDPATVPVGRIHLELRPDNHLMFPGLGAGPLCGPRATDDCGA